MAYRELELTLLSAQDLKSVNLITRMDVYAVVSISGDPLTRQCTPPDTYGGRNPCWDATFRFAVPPTSTAAAAASASLHVLLRAERFLGDRDVGEVVIPLAEILAGATGVGPQPPKVASYHVRKLHRWEPRGVLNVSYRLGPVVAPVVEWPTPAEKPAAVTAVYAPVGVPRHPSHDHPSSAVAYQAPPPRTAPTRSPAAVRVVAEHDDAAAQNQKSPVMGLPLQPSHPPAKPDAYRPPAPPTTRPAAAGAGHEEARGPPTPARPAPTTPPPTRNNGRLGQPGPTHVYMCPHTQIIFGSAPTTTTATAAGPPATWTTTTTSPAGSTISPAGKKSDGNYSTSAAESISMSVISPRSRKEDRRRPTTTASVLSHSHSQHDTQQQQQQPAASSPVAAAAASPFSSRSSSFSSPVSPYSSAHPSPSSSSAHSSTRSPYSTFTSPYPSLRSPSAASDAAEVTHGTNHTFRSGSSRGGAIVSSPLPSWSPMVPNHSRGAAAVSSPLPSWSPMVPNHSRGAAAVSSPLPSSSPMVPNHSRGAAAVSSPLPSSSPLVP
ncbi:DNA-directed RNA polymerase II subunit RPB1-like [Sorghum bicolor]|uniref:DNA-directed RNA polymerase II subunit RPB1-like n=1 Tax=Sorghum bicolor TaxID=4558 RepID=UPI00081AB38E|nr:DNA-directed RNA polymerase II subunit RPB1-like [Sorghum bicolor]|eukprot:XP_021319154.1 DNA-directed RNA polymerase II subunit RPB1-like [Sorghum bicolor]